MKAADAKEGRGVVRRQRGAKPARRKHGRFPILVQIEAQARKGLLLGRATDISPGGMLVETTETLPLHTDVVVRFSLPPEDRRIEAAGRVVRERRGRSLGVSFLGLAEDDRRKVVDYMVHYLRRWPPTLPLFGEEKGPGRRRSGRVRRRSAVTLSWEEEGGHTRQETVETQNLSKYGALVFSFSQLPPGHLVRLTTTGARKAATARVLSCREAKRPGRMEIALEFVGEEDFWGIPFPVEPSTRPAVDRRRSQRLPRWLGVVLSWEDELGRKRQELGDTLNVSRHGAALSSVVELPICQQLRLRAPQIQREAEAHVVWVRPGAIAGRTDMGIEFLQEADFWGIAFPPPPGAAAN
ncbi:MAG: PilZ domain-containing protein [Terriglobia bacterium]